MPRVPLIQNRDDVAPEHYALFDELAALRGRISGPSTVVLHSPGLARPWNEISEYLHGVSIVAPHYAELAVCATAREQDCGYVWNAHVAAARRAGVDEAGLTALGDYRSRTGFPSDLDWVVRFTQELLRTNRVDDEVFQALLQAHDMRWLVELTVWIGRYAALAGILNGFEVNAVDPTALLPEAKAPSELGIGMNQPPSQPRVPLVISRDQVAAGDGAIFELLQSRPGLGRVRAMLLHSPELGKRISDVDEWLSADSQVVVELRELAILATARERDATYLWSTHVPLAREAGVGETIVDAVRDRASLEAFPLGMREVVDYVRQQLQTHRIAEQLFERLREQYGVRWLVEVTCLIGHYALISGIVNAFELESDEGADQLPEA